MDSPKPSFVTLMYHLEDMVEDAAQQTKRVLEARERLTARIVEIEDEARKAGYEEARREAQSSIFPRIALIKLVREATQQHMRKEVTERSTIGEPLMCMGLKDAKDLVDAWIADQISKGLLTGGVI